MCTCNAGKLLSAQLASLTAQTRLPSHIAVCDDRSDDGTWTELQAWAERVRAGSAIRVTLIRNEERLGVARNFEKAITCLDTELIFLADQDDVWAPEKIAHMASRLECNPETLLAHSDAVLIDEEGNDLGKSLFEALSLTVNDRELAARGKFFEVYCRRNLVTGTTTAFRRELLDIALPFPPFWIHDEWLAACAAGLGQVAMLPDKLTYYRQHGKNVIGVSSSAAGRVWRYAMRVFQTPRDEHLRFKLNRLAELHARLEKSGRTPREKLALLDEAESHFRRRLAFGGVFRGRLAGVFREFHARGYHRFADGLGGVLRDLIHF